jgi:hypothetical protein
MKSGTLEHVRSLFLSAVALSVFAPAVALAQAQPPGPGPKPECAITVNEGRCSATLCGPIGNYGYNWVSKELPPGAISTQCITVNRSGTYILELVDPTTGKPVVKCATSVLIGKCTNLPPDCSGAHAKDGMIWPPNHQMEPVVIEGVVDPDGDPVLIEVYAVTQDEPLNVEGDGNTCADAVIVDGQASVRAERTGDPNIPGNGRVYFLSFVASDGMGGRCKGRIQVCVPHDMGQGDSCIDDGQFYDSLGECPQP